MTDPSLLQERQKRFHNNRFDMLEGVEVTVAQHCLFFYGSANGTEVRKSAHVVLQAFVFLLFFRRRATQVWSIAVELSKQIDIEQRYGMQTGAFFRAGGTVPPTLWPALNSFCAHVIPAVLI